MSYAKLKGKILEVFGTQAAFAEALGINKATLNGKLNNRSQWSSNEIAKACDLLGVSLCDAHLYFFCVNGCVNATE